MNEDRKRRRSGQAPSGGSPVYGLGFIGALAWYWPQAHDPQQRAKAVLKAMAWPAFLVYEVYRALSRVPSDKGLGLAA